MNNKQKIEEVVYKTIGNMQEKCSCKLFSDENGCMNYPHYRDITLAYILYTLPRHYAIDRSGGFLKYRYENGWEVEEFRATWNLLLPFNEQSEEVYQFIAELL